ncbi:phasin family protein [Acetobacterium paludosum]|uniref:phasin family protein n=1 Tax=Acetobacterium paludosum TaxID=52693 RepID=UPI00164AB503|nr:hypothetical protein [Acetobacterium paludosum]
MLENIGEDLRRIFLFGVGAVATTAEKSKELIDELVVKGELTVEQGKVLNEELKHNIKETIKDNVTVNVIHPETPPTVDTVVENLNKMTPEEIQKIKETIEMMETEPSEKSGIDECQ